MTTLKKNKNNQLSEESVPTQEAADQEDQMVTDGVDPDVTSVETPTAELPPDVTKEPRNGEEVHLDAFHGDPDMTIAYLRVSDDDGPLHGNPDLEQRVKNFINQHADGAGIAENEIDEKLSQIKELVGQYSAVVTRSEAFCAGVITKYRLREAMLLNIAKQLIKKKGLTWEEHFNANYPESSRRSAQDYMRLAKIPRIIGYAVFGKERLLEIIRAIKPAESDDPIGAFLLQNDINFTPDDDDLSDITELKTKVDAALVMEKVQSIAQKNGVDLEVDPQKIEMLIALGKEPSDSLLKKMVTMQKFGGDANAYLDEICMNGGADVHVAGSSVTAESLPTIIARVKSIREHISDDASLLDQIKLQDIEALEGEIAALKQLKNNQ
ncbi:hypothetical protein [Desulfosudis oleivorans]|uniref:Uncharacterized protein n=1 Tax=Desulfosudis oleivorans (strain DSM 6200 / JCM 39069 / Hxd3) TaxID=96561 RepID=A8ZYI7_DESOH|nr:hypothetical protein [Desulfosudis oleivorans]ABW68712.1 hypothetical protein Dole_2909 [Desulfosudis oleivorans Hxd3]